LLKQQQQHRPVDSNMGADAHSVGSNAFAWFMNVSSAVTIVFVNKVLMDHKKGYAFTFGG
jgi:hypothetical protein